MSAQNEVKPLVSVLMPAYKSEYLQQALESVVQQSYRPLELIICDDCRTNEVKLIVDRFSQLADFPITYRHNPKRLNEINNLASCIELSQGEYLKFLYDDDLLEPDCIESLLRLLQDEPSVTLASSRRVRIDESGGPLPDIYATCYPFDSDVLIDGKELVSFLVDHTVNFIGEPSSVMCRRADVEAMGTTLSTLNGVRIHWVGDLAIYAKLLQHGNLAMRAKPLSKFRVSAQQISQRGRDQQGIGEQGHENFRQAIRDLGWYRGDEANAFVNVAKITSVKKRIFKPVNLLLNLHRAFGFGRVSLPYWMSARTPKPIQKKLMDQYLKNAGGGPLFAIVLIDRNSSQDSIYKTLISLENTNLYNNYEVHILSSDSGLEPTNRVKFHKFDVLHEAISVNKVVNSSSADWVILADAGVEFTASGLLISALDLLSAPECCEAVYADELLRLEGNQIGLSLKPDLNLDFLLSLPSVFSRHWLLRRETLLSFDGFSSDFASAYVLEYQLRLIAQRGLASVGHVSEPLLTSDDQPIEDSIDVRQVLAAHLAARGYVNSSISSRFPGIYDIHYGHEAQPSVSILVVVKDRLPQIQRCMETLLEHTSYSNYEVVLLDHGNTDPALSAWLGAVEQMGVAHLRVLHFEESLSKAQVCNQASVHARGDYLLWLGDGAGIMGKDWLAQMLNHAQRPEVGVVGGKLLAASGQVAHAGLILGLGGPAGRAFEGAQIDDPGYMQRLLVDQNYSAVSADCLMISRQLFEQAQGFDESPLLARWYDVDLCLRLTQAGYLNVWTPRVQFLMDTTEHTPATDQEEEAMYVRWLPVLAQDPAYNTGFSLNEVPGFKLADPKMSWRPLQGLQSIPSVIAYNADTTGCGHYRVIQPFNAMRDAGLLEGQVLSEYQNILEITRYMPDTMVFQRQVSEQGIEHIRKIKALTQTFKVFELDDYLPNLPLKNIHRQNMPKDILRSIRQGLSFVDRFVVSTQALAEAFSGVHNDIHVIKNCLPTHWWGDLKSLRRVSSKPRVGWAGGISHTGDLDLIVDVVRELANEVEWVFFGMCPDKIRHYVSEFHPGVSIHEYPEKLASLNLDLAIAPVEQNLFNDCKSNLRLLEYGACAYPVIASDVRCYQETGLPVTLVKNRFKDWVDAIRMHLADLNATALLGDNLQACVMRDWTLEGQNLEKWRSAWMPT